MSPEREKEIRADCAAGRFKWADVDDLLAALDEARKDAARLELVWFDEPPRHPGLYWHWNGDDDCAPVPLSVMWSGTNAKCFVSMGQYGIEHAIDCDVYGGWWAKIREPGPPTEEQRHKAIAHPLRQSAMQALKSRGDAPEAGK